MNRRDQGGDLVETNLIGVGHMQPQSSQRVPDCPVLSVDGQPSEFLLSPNVVSRINAKLEHF